MPSIRSARPSAAPGRHPGRPTMATRTTTSRTTSRSSTTPRRPIRTTCRRRRCRDRHRHPDLHQRRAAVQHRQPPVRHERLRLTRGRHHARVRSRPITCRPSASSRRPGYQDGHAGYSDPIDEQKFIVDEINALESTPDWSSTAVVIAYDDSDGWYDHVYSGVHNPSNTQSDAAGPQDFLTGTGLCGDTTAPPLAGQNGRCGYGPRLPLLVISPWAKPNFVDAHPDRPEFHHQVRRGQLGAAEDQRLLRRRSRER